MPRVLAQVRTQPIEELFQCELQCFRLNVQLLTAGAQAARAAYSNATVHSSWAMTSRVVLNADRRSSRFLLTSQL